MTVTIRRPERRDEAEWKVLFRTYCDFYGADVPDEVVALTWSRLTGPDPPLFGLVAVGAGPSLVGFAVALFHPSSWSATCVCYLEDLYVAPGARGMGVGRHLIEAVYEAADAREATRTYWVTEETNDRARSLYDQLAKRAPFVQYRR